MSFLCSTVQSASQFPTEKPIIFSFRNETSDGTASLKHKTNNNYISKLYTKSVERSQQESQALSHYHAWTNIKNKTNKQQLCL